MNTTQLSPTPVNSAHSACELRLTLIDQALLGERLRAELLFLFRTARNDWPTFKSDPTAYLGRKVIDCWQFAVQKLRTPHLIVSGVSAFSILGVILLAVALIDSKANRTISSETTEAVDYEPTIISFPQQPDPDPAKGVGANSNGRVGFRSGAGEGSKADAKRSSGGGGGGLQHQVTQQKGKLPPPSDIPAPIPALPVARTRALPVAGIDIDPALWRAENAAVFGDPRSKSAAVSNGPGTGGGMGNGDGPGVGDGHGAGVGPGEHGNIGDGPKGSGGGVPGGSNGNRPVDPNHVWRVSEVQRARVLSKPEPQYTEEARKNQVTGTVVLRVIFSRSGEVTGIRAVSALPFGLTARAIAAARQIRFQPATRNGEAVSVHMQLEYNFNLY